METPATFGITETDVIEFKNRVQSLLFHEITEARAISVVPPLTAMKMSLLEFT